jgi:hypothetical protein
VSIWRLTWRVTRELFVTANEFGAKAVEERELHILCSVRFFFGKCYGFRNHQTQERDIARKVFFLTCPLFDARTGDASRRVVSTVLLKV